MTLSALIRKREPEKPANANPAKAANDVQEEGEPLAGLAALALANLTEAKVTTSLDWLLHYPARDPVHVFCLPESTCVEVLTMYPDAIAAEPIPERTCTQPTSEQKAELRALIATVGVAYTFTLAEQQEAIALALNDPGAALLSYRDMAREARQQKVIAMLEATPETQRAIYTDTASDPHNVILTIAVRNLETCEMLIPKAKYDPWRLLELIEQYGAQNVQKKRIATW